MSDARRLLASVFLDDILPIFVVAGVGFLLARRVDVSVKALSRVTFNALAPCLVFHLLATSTVSGAEFGRMALFCVLVVAAAGLLARVVTLPLGLDRPTLAAFLLVVMFSNSGNYGLPVTRFAFGQDALTFASIYFVTSSVLTYTAGVFMAASGRRTLAEALRGVLRVPALYAVGAAALVLATGVELPVMVERPVSLLGDAALPMMILVLGMQLEGVKQVERPRLVALAAAVSLLGTPVVAFGLSGLLGLTGPALQAGMVQACMPSAVITTILALEFDVRPAFVTSVVFVSTLASPVTLTVVIALLQGLG